MAISFDKLDSEIEQYVSEYGSFDPYLFMSTDTATAIVNEVGFESAYPNSNIKLTDGAKARYCGYKVFIDDSLKLGMVEIR